VLQAPDSVAKSNFLKRHEIVASQALPLKIETLFPHPISRITFATPATSYWRFF
jgi:hypothetical protein